MKKQADSLRDESAQIVTEHAQSEPSGPVVFQPAPIARTLDYVRKQRLGHHACLLCD